MAYIYLKAIMQILLDNLLGCLDVHSTLSAGI